MSRLRLTFAASDYDHTRDLITGDVPVEGIDLNFQAANITAGGAFLGTFDLSNGLRIRIGSLIAGCP